MTGGEGRYPLVLLAIDVDVDCEGHTKGQRAMDGEEDKVQQVAFAIPERLWPSHGAMCLRRGKPVERS